MIVNKFLNASVGLTQLQQEPARLRAEAVQSNESLESLVQENYRLILANLHINSSIQLREEEARLQKLLNELSSSLSPLSSTSSSFQQKANALLNEHRRNRKTLRLQMELIELLEVPQLVDACARNGFHEEALELANFVNQLETRNLLATQMRAKTAGKLRENGTPSSSSSVVESIVAEVQRSLAGLRSTLLRQLREQETMAQHLNTLAILRKLDAFFIERMLSLEPATPLSSSDEAVSAAERRREVRRLSLLRNAETKLQMEFLEARSQWMQTSLAAKFERRMSSLPRHTSVSAREAAEEGAGGAYGKAIELLETNRSACTRPFSSSNLSVDDWSRAE